jgi:hypothetical protein
MKENNEENKLTKQNKKTTSSFNIHHSCFKGKEIFFQNMIIGCC